MNRITTNNPVNAMSIIELAHNCMYLKNQEAWYRDHDTDIPLRQLVHNMAVSMNIELPEVDDDAFDMGWKNQKEDLLCFTGWGGRWLNLGSICVSMRIQESRRNRMREWD